MKDGRQKREELLKVKENLVIIVRLNSLNPAKTQQEIIDWIFHRDDVEKIIHQERTVEHLAVVPKRELEKVGIKFWRR
jgi:hypothetical protein